MDLVWGIVGIQEWFKIIYPVDIFLVRKIIKFVTEKKKDSIWKKEEDGGASCRCMAPVQGGGM